MKKILKQFAQSMSLENHKLEKIKIFIIKKSIVSLLLIVTGTVFMPASVAAQEIAIVKSFDDPEIDSLQSYLNSMGLASTTFDKNTFSYDSVANYDLLIWDDLSYQSGGISDNTVSIFEQFYTSGKPLYFIGDDLAYSIINLSQGWDSVWINLLHLSGVNNFSQSYNVQIINNSHLVTNGAFGQVNNFDYSLDIDYATRTNTGEQVLASTTDSDVLLVYEGTYARTVTQNCLVVQAGSDSSITERKKIFKNAVAWLLGGYTGIGVTESRNKIFNLYPNPASDIATLKIENPSSTGLTINIYNVIGNLIKSEILKQNNRQINIGDLRDGVYMVEIKSKDWTGKQKLIIQR